MPSDATVKSDGPTRGVTSRDFASDPSVEGGGRRHASSHLTAPAAHHPRPPTRHDDHVQRLYIGPHIVGEVTVPAHDEDETRHGRRSRLRHLARRRHDATKLWKHAMRHGEEGKRKSKPADDALQWRGGSYTIGADVRSAYTDSATSSAPTQGSSKDMLDQPQRTDSPTPMDSSSDSGGTRKGKGKAGEERDEAQARKVTPDQPAAFLEQIASPGRTPDASANLRVPETPSGPRDARHGAVHNLLRRVSSTAMSKTASTTAAIRSPAKDSLQRAKSTRFADDDDPSDPSDLLRPRGDSSPAPPEEVLNRNQDAQAPPSPFAHEDEQQRDPWFRRDRMLVRQGWAPKARLPKPFDARFARETQVGYLQWEELVVVYHRQRIELWGRSHGLGLHHLQGRLKPRHVIPLHKGTTSLSVYNHSEAILCLTLSTSAHVAATARRRLPTQHITDHFRKEGCSVFLLRPLTPSIAADWCFDLWQELGGEIPKLLTLWVPELGARLVMPVPEEASDADAADWRTEENDMTTQSGHRYAVAGYKLLTPVKVIEKATKLIDSVGEWRELHLERGGKDLELALAWRNDDVVSWITEDSLEAGRKRDSAIMAGFALHECRRKAEGGLELRTAVHYPDCVRDRSGHRISEPPAIEGYLSRVHGRGGLRRERLYLLTVNSDLFIVEPKHARPPEPPLPLSDTMPARERLALLGGAYMAADESDPIGRFLVQLGDENTPRQSMSEADVDDETLREHVLDRFIRHERIRTCELVEGARGYLDLRAIDEVKLTTATGSPRVHQQDDSLGANESDEEVHSEADVPDTGTRLARSLEIKLSNGRVTRFEARSESDAMEWVGRLDALAKYWRAREHADALEQMTTSPGNAFRTRASYRDAAIGVADALDPLADRPDPLAYSRAFDFCSLQGCRGILRGGRLYASNKANTARAKERWYVLIRGGLVAFKLSHVKPLSGTEVPSIFHGRSGKRVDLKGAYIVTGSVCHIDPRSTGENPFDGEKEGRSYADGLIAYDDEAQCTFELWRPSSKKVGSKGHVTTFRARSRIERDGWAWAIGQEMERLGREHGVGTENIGKTV